MSGSGQSIIIGAGSTILRSDIEVVLSYLMSQDVYESLEKSIWFDRTHLLWIQP